MDHYKFCWVTFKEYKQDALAENEDNNAERLMRA